MTRHYLDNNATAPMRPEVASLMQELAHKPLNASSVHQYGREARFAIENARAKIATLLNADGQGIIFTASGTEANNLALRGIAASQYYVSAIEHASVRKTVPHATLLPVTADGVVDVEQADKILSRAPKGAMVSVMLANNETGVVQPVGKLRKIAHEHGALIHCDAVQAVGKMPVDFRRLGVDMMTISAHKLGGPQGAAALIVGSCLPLTAQITGGGQELYRRAGTENVAAIAGFGLAVELATRDEGRMESLRQRRDTMESNLLRECPNAVVFGARAERLPNTSCIAMPGVSSETQLMALDLDGVMVSAGSACSSGKVDVSHVLLAMGADKDTASTAIRISTGWNTESQDIDALLTAWTRLYQRAGMKHEERKAA